MVPGQPPPKRGRESGQDVPLSHDGHRHLAGRERLPGVAYAVSPGDGEVRACLRACAPWIDGEKMECVCGVILRSFCFHGTNSSGSFPCFLSLLLVHGNPSMLVVRSKERIPRDSAIVLPIDRVSVPCCTCLLPASEARLTAAVMNGRRVRVVRNDGGGGGGMAEHIVAVTITIPANSSPSASPTAATWVRKECSELRLAATLSVGLRADHFVMHCIIWCHATASCFPCPAKQCDSYH